MTEQEYKDLQAWCQVYKNKKDPEYKAKVDLRNKATQIRRNFISYKGLIRQAMFVLENCTKVEAKAKWLGIIEIYKKDRDIWQQKFKDLIYESKD